MTTSEHPQTRTDPTTQVSATRSATTPAGPRQPARPNTAQDSSPSRRGRGLVLAIILTAVFMQLLDTTITTVAVPSIQANLGATFADVQLVLAGYSLAFACILITSGRLGDLYGRKRLFLLGMSGFTLASVLCGAAPTAGLLVGARILQGLCSGLMFPQVLSIIQVLYPKVERPKALALYGATIGVATILGPVTGGFLIDLNVFGSEWRSIFYINLPIGLVALTLGALRIPESRAPQASRLDLPGAVLVTTGLFLLVLPVVIGRDHGWPTWSFLMMASSAVVLAVLARYEVGRTRRNADPLVPTTLFRERPFTIGLAACLVFFTGIPSFFFVLLLSLQAGFGYSAVKAGGVTLAFALAVAIGSGRSAHAARRIGTRVLVVGAGLLVVGELALIGTLTWVGTDLVAWQLIPSLFVAGAGAGLFLAPVTGVVLAGIGSQNAGAASGLLATAQQVGAAIGVAVVGVLFFGLLGNNAGQAIDYALPQLRSDLIAAGLPAPARAQVEANFRTCFSDRAHASDPTAQPASCQAALAAVRTSPAPAPVKAAVLSAVQDRAVPAARHSDFSHALPQLLWWQVGVFALSGLLALRLPRVDLTGKGPLIGGG